MSEFTSIDEMLDYHRPTANDITERLNNNYAIHPSLVAVSDSEDGQYENDGANHYLDRQGVVFAENTVFAGALSIGAGVDTTLDTMGIDMSRAYALVVKGQVNAKGIDGRMHTVKRDGVGLSTGEPYKAYSGAQTVGEKRMLTTFGNACGLFLSRANRADGRFSLDIYKTEYDAAIRRGDTPSVPPSVVDGVNLKAFDILRFPGRFKMNAMEAQSETIRSNFVARFFARPTIIQMLNQYLGLLAWSYEIEHVEIGIRHSYDGTPQFYGAIDATLTLWPNSEARTSYTQRGYAEGESVRLALYGADTAALKRLFSYLGPAGGIQFWDDKFNLNMYRTQFEAALEAQRADKDSTPQVCEDMLLPDPPGWVKGVPEDRASVDRQRAYQVSAGKDFLPAGFSGARDSGAVNIPYMPNTQAAVTGRARAN